MAGLDEVMERLVTDPHFASQLASDSTAALAGYELTPNELELLAARAQERAGQSHVEQRISKAGLAGLLSLRGEVGDEPPRAGDRQSPRHFPGLSSRISQGELEGLHLTTGATSKPPALDAVMAEWSRTDSPGTGTDSLSGVEPGDAPDAGRKDGTILIKGKDITVGGSSGGSDPRRLAVGDLNDAPEQGADRLAGGGEQAGDQESSDWTRVGTIRAGATEHPSGAGVGGGGSNQIVAEDTPGSDAAPRMDTREMLGADDTLRGMEVAPEQAGGSATEPPQPLPSEHADTVTGNPTTGDLGPAASDEAQAGPSRGRPPPEPPAAL